MAISHQKVPKDGWKYKEARTNTTIVTLTWENLVEGVTTHRKSNGINVGDVEGDIDRQIEALHPELTINVPV